jgi:hypothetical protein
MLLAEVILTMVVPYGRPLFHDFLLHYSFKLTEFARLLLMARAVFAHVPGIRSMKSMKLNMSI